MENQTSEQQLKQLFDEGKISEEEYEQLLSAMSNKSNQEKEQQVSSETEFNSFIKRVRNRIVTISIILSVLGLLFGLYLRITYLWILSIAALIYSGIYLRRLKDHWLSEFLYKQNKKIPHLLWIALVSLILMVLIKIVYASKTGPLILIDAAFSVILLVGIYLGHKWAYIATIIFILLGTLLGFVKNPTLGLEIFCIDGLVLVPVLFCTNYFFQKSNQNH